MSTHGGRQLDNAVAELDSLTSVVDVVGDCVPVLFDSGIHTGTDVLMALSMAASAVMIGSPWLYALAVGGQAGVEHLLALPAQRVLRRAPSDGPHPLHHVVPR